MVTGESARLGNMAQLRAGRRSSYAAPSRSRAGCRRPRRRGQQKRRFFSAPARAEALGYRIEWFALDDRRSMARLSGISGRAAFSAQFCGQQVASVAFSGKLALAPSPHEVGHELHRTMATTTRGRESATRRVRGYRGSVSPSRTSRSRAPSLPLRLRLRRNARRDHVPSDRGAVGAARSGLGAGTGPTSDAAMTIRGWLARGHRVPKTGSSRT